MKRNHYSSKNILMSRTPAANNFGPMYNVSKLCAVLALFWAHLFSAQATQCENFLNFKTGTPSTNGFNVTFHLNVEFVEGQEPRLRVVAPPTVHPTPHYQVINRPVRHPPPVRQNLGSQPPLRDQLSDQQQKSTTNHAYNLSQEGRLLRQTDPTLASLILPDGRGGLCTSACGENLLHILTSYLGKDTTHFARNPGFVVRAINRDMWADHRIDTRFGLDINYMPSALKRTTQGYLGFDLQVFKTLEGFSISTDHLIPRENEGIIGAFYAGWNHQTRSYDSHAVLILGLNRAQNTIFYIDPNTPHLVSQAAIKWWRHRHGHATIKMNHEHAFSEQNDIGAFFQMTRYRIAPKAY